MVKLITLRESIFSSTRDNFNFLYHASANTALDERMHQLPNTFSMIVPLVLDSAIVENSGNLSHLKPWAISSEGYSSMTAQPEK